MQRRTDKWEPRHNVDIVIWPVYKEKYCRKCELNITINIKTLTSNSSYILYKENKHYLETLNPFLKVIIRFSPNFRGFKYLMIKNDKVIKIIFRLDPPGSEPTTFKLKIPLKSAYIYNRKISKFQSSLFFKLFGRFSSFSKGLMSMVVQTI